MIYPRWQADRYGVYMNSNIHDQQQSPYKQGLSQSASRNIMRDYGRNLMTPLLHTTSSSSGSDSNNNNTYTYSPNKLTSTTHTAHTHNNNNTNTSNNKHSYTTTATPPAQKDKLLEAYYTIKYHNKYPYINNTYIIPTYNNTLIHPYKHLRLTTDLKRDQTKRLIGGYIVYCILVYCEYILYMCGICCILTCCILYSILHDVQTKPVVYNIVIYL